MRSSKTSDARLTALFLDMLAAEQGAGDNTLDAYRRDLTDFSEFLARSGQGFAGVETQALRDYLADLDARGFKSSSVARRLSAMRHLFRFLLNERLRSDDPAAVLSGPKRGRGLPKVLSIADVDRLLVRAKALAMRRKPLRCSGFARCGCIACSRCSTPPACGCRNWWRCRARHRGAMPR
jgi:integrase/recombinase XerD